MSHTTQYKLVQSVTKSSSFTAPRVWHKVRHQFSSNSNK